jgi:hypothetical protein
MKDLYDKPSPWQAKRASRWIKKTVLCGVDKITGAQRAVEMDWGEQYEVSTVMMRDCGITYYRLSDGSIIVNKSIVCC